MKHAKRGRSTLADLERRTGCRRKPRPHAAGFSADVEAWKGRPANRRRRGIFGIINGNASGGNGKSNGHRPTAARSSPTVTARAYDHGAPVHVNGHGNESRRYAIARSAAESWAPVAFEADGFESTVAFAVESFDETAVTPPDPRVDTPAPPSMPSVSVPAPAPPVVEMPVATALGYGVDQDGLLGLELGSASRADDADQFEREIQAILSGQTVRPAKAASVDDAAGPPPAPAPASAHDIFEQMGHNMAYANAFHLPPIEVRRRFDDLEREIVREEALQAEAATPVMSLELSDDELSAGLMMTGVAPVGHVAPVARVAPVAPVAPIGARPAAPPEQPAPQQAVPAPEMLPGGPAVAPAPATDAAPPIAPAAPATAASPEGAPAIVPTAITTPPVESGRPTP